MCYFGPWDDPQGALEKWLAWKDDLLAGRVPRPTGNGVTVATLCNHFLTHKKSLVDTGELAERSFAVCCKTCERLVTLFGGTRPVENLGAGDFQHLRNNIAKSWGPVALANEIQRVRSVFKYAYDAGLLDKPVRFGPGFKKPSAKTLRQARAERGLRMFEQEELLAVLKNATGNIKAMILLGANCALGNTDLALMPTEAVDLKAGWLNYPRPKTAVPRRVPLWPETIDALRAVLAARRKPKDPADKHLIFIGPRGESYIGRHRGYRVAAEMTRLLDDTGIKRSGLSFYALRHTFQTVAEGTKDLAAVQAIMGHAPASNDMSAVYRERVDDSRLTAVSNHLRQWLFGADVIARAGIGANNEPEKPVEATSG
jgi:integrase